MSNHVPKLPCLPGFNFDTKIGQTKFNKTHYFDKIHDDVYYLAEKPHASEHNRYSSIFTDEESQKPPWIVFDKQKLVFKAYFEEMVPALWESRFRIREVKIFFFLEDGTMKISEPTSSNSGLEQGVLVRRQRIPIPDAVKYRFYDIIDLNVRKELEIFGRVYKIVDCDQFTRRFLNRMGIPVSDPIAMPSDPHDKKKKINVPQTFHRKVDTLGKFLKYDRQVLRFYGYWDDRDSPYGMIHDLEIHYYLADDTMEVKEIVSLNSGKDADLMHIKKIKIPKFFCRLDDFGSKEPFTILNIMGENTSRTPSYFVVDRLNTGQKTTDYYKDSDLYIGATVNVFGRKVVITDMDDATKNYYRTKYGIEDFTPKERPEKKEEACKNVEKYIPPYNGYGSYEDSLGNCLSVIPKPPRIDYIKFFYYDKQDSDSHVLRFRAKMISNDPLNAKRQFIIRIFLIDDTISIYELADRNTGFKRCVFQKRMKVMLPGQNIFTNQKPKYYEPQDFYIGAVLNLNGFQFELISADLYALRYMEANCDKFHKSNANLIMEKLRKALRPVYSEFCQQYTPQAKNGKILIWEYNNLKVAFRKYLKDNITEHEMITIARQFSSHEKKEFCSREYVRAIVHNELNRLLWDKLDRMEESIHHVDRDRSGYLSRKELYTILRGCRVPLDIELLNSMLDHISKNETGLLDYRDLLKFMNVTIDPVPPVPPVNIKTALWWASEREPDCGAGVDWCTFLKELGLDEEEKFANASSTVVD